MIITEDEYGFVSYQDFKAYSNKVYDAIDEYSTFDECEDYALVINGNTLDFEICPLLKLKSTRIHTR